MFKTGISCNSEGKRIEKHFKRGGGEAFNGDCGKLLYLRCDISVPLVSHSNFWS